MVIVLYILCENRTKKPLKIILSRGRMRKNDGGGEPNQGML
jgi:hypothetical protein